MSKKTSNILSNKHFIVILVLAICVASSTIIPFFINDTNELSYLSKINIVLQIISNIFVVAGVFIAVWQYYLNSKSERIKLNKESIQKAIDLSSFYKDNILSNYCIIKYVYDNSGATEILNHINTKQMIEFDEQELKELLTAQQIEQLKTIQKSEKFVSAVNEANYIFNLNITCELFGKEEVDSKKYTQEFINNIVCKTLNNMEFFALHFKYNTADSDTVYQSLHKTYLEITRTLYYNIAKCNTLNSTRLYTNLIYLYNEWNTIAKKQLKNITNSNRNSVINGNGVEKLD